MEKLKLFFKKISKYFFELLVVVFGVYLGFMANNYSEELKVKDYIKTTIKEMYQSLGQDISDAELNKKGHEVGLYSTGYIMNLIKNQEVKSDSFVIKLQLTTRTFVSIQNTAPFEALKARGLNLISNDSLRSKIIKLYDFQYDVLEKIEEKYQESQLYSNEANHISDILSKSLTFDNDFKISKIKLPLDLSNEERSKLILIIKRIRSTRYFNIAVYDEVIQDMYKVRTMIANEYPFVLNN